MRRTAAGSCAAPRRPRTERPSDIGRSKSASVQISIGFRRRVRMSERALRGLSGRRGNGGTKGLEAWEAAGMANALNQDTAEFMTGVAPATGATARIFVVGER